MSDGAVNMPVTIVPGSHIIIGDCKLPINLIGKPVKITAEGPWTNIHIRLVTSGPVTIEEAGQ